MVIKTVEFIKGVIGTEGDVMNKKPTFAFVGRSNVGKSSVINSLVNRKDLARSSSTPGRTQQINYFLVNNEVFFADLPGYGYARVSMKQQEKIRKMIVWYLTSKEVDLRAVILIVDVRVGMKEMDVAILDAMREVGRDVIVVANKIDALKQSVAHKNILDIKGIIGEYPLVVYSAKTKRGRDELLEELKTDSL